MKHRVERTIGGTLLSFETGQLAKQASASILAQYGDTVVLCAVTDGSPRPGIDFFPLMCDYRERLSAAGKFPGGFLKRESRPSMKETLTARLTDRPIRPLFTPGYKDEVQCQSIVLSSDRQNDADVIAMNGTAAALFISPLPFQGPIASVRIGRINGELVAFPSQDDLEESDLDLIVSGSEDAVLMIEGFSREMQEEEMFVAIQFAHATIKELCELQHELADKVGVEKNEFVPPEDDGLLAKVQEQFTDALKQAKQTDGKLAREDAIRQVRDDAQAAMIPDPEAEDAVSDHAFFDAWHDLESHVVRQMIMEGVRQDGRKPDELRDLDCIVDVLPRTHGSAVFQRGETQALVTVTLGTGRDEQRVDGLMEEYSKKFMLDYNFPPFSVG
ncbi:MAG: polyribonucleotide nucleotidyltransferase, partial [Pirellulaceae bacterium]